jgi:hypothetical protein
MGEDGPQVQKHDGIAHAGQLECYDEEKHPETIEGAGHKKAFLIPGFPRAPHAAMPKAKPEEWGRHAQACHGDAGKGEPFIKSRWTRKSPWLIGPPAQEGLGRPSKHSFVFPLFEIKAAIPKAYSTHRSPAGLPRATA